MHIVAVPLITLVGRVLTVTTALPVLSAAIDVHFESLRAVTVYVVVVDIVRIDVVLDTIAAVVYYSVVGYVVEVVARVEKNAAL